MSPKQQENEEIIDNEIPHDQGTAEQQAARLGWVPKDQYKGKSPWVSAEEYLERLREDSPRLRHVNDKLAREVEELKKTNEAILSHHERQLKQERQSAYDEAYAAAEKKHAQAVAAGDVEGATKAVTDMKALDKQIANVPAAPAKPAMTTEERELVADFKADNADWYGIDPEMTKFANEYENNLAKSNVPLDKRLAMTLEKVKRRYPQEFTEMNNDALDEETPTPIPRATPTRQAAPAGRNNSSGVRRPAARIEPGSYEALTTKGRAECDRHVRSHPEPKRAAARATWLKFARNDATLFQS